MPEFAACAPVPSFTVGMLAEVRAERSRVFQALTIPEYIEVWSAESHVSEVACRTELWPGGNYEISIRRHSGGLIVARGQVLDYQPFDTIVCSLDLSGLSLISKSFVTLMLEQSDGITRLGLTHACIASIEQARYFRRMWTGCFTRLFKLFAYRQPSIILVHASREAELQSSDLRRA